jgi:hypothetical protein
MLTVTKEAKEQLETVMCGIANVFGFEDLRGRLLICKRSFL